MGLDSCVALVIDWTHIDNMCEVPEALFRSVQFLVTNHRFDRRQIVVVAFSQLTTIILSDM